MKNKAYITREKLDRIFHDYTEESGFENKLLKYKLLEVRSYLKGDRILDVGCGLGILTNALAPYAKEVVGIDGSAEKITLANQNHPDNVSYLLALFEEYKPDRKFDTVIMTNVLEHMPDPVLFLHTVSNWLTPQGRVICTVPNALGLHKQLGYAMGLIDNYYQLTDADKGKGHYKNYSTDSLKKDVIKAGYRVLQTHGFFLKPLSSKQMESFNDDILDGLYELGRMYPGACSSLIVVGEKK